MPNKLAQLSVPEAFAMDDLYAKLQDMAHQSFGDPAYWQALMGASGLPGAHVPLGGPYAPQHVGVEPADYRDDSDNPGTDPDVWREQMANAGAPGLQNYATQPLPVSPGQHAADYAQGLSTALNQNITRLAKERIQPGAVATPADKQEAGSENGKDLLLPVETRRMPPGE